MDEDCVTFERLISARLDGDISRADGVALQAHLSRCANCRHFEESVRLCRERLRLLPDLAADAPRLHSARETKGGDRLWTGRISLPIPAAAALAGFMLAGWLWALWPSSRSIATSPSRPVRVCSVEIIRAQPAQVICVEPGGDDSLNRKEDGI